MQLFESDNCFIKKQSLIVLYYAPIAGYRWRWQNENSLANSS